MCVATQCTQAYDMYDKLVYVTANLKLKMFLETQYSLNVLLSQCCSLGSDGHIASGLEACVQPGRVALPCQSMLHYRRPLLWLLFD